MAQIELRGVSARYPSGGQVLDGVSLVVDKGEVVSIIGPSGSGKSTLLRVLVGLLPPSAGEVWLDGSRLDYADRKALTAARARLAIVFQQFNLFQNMTALDNVTVTPVKIRREPKASARARGEALLRRVGLGDKLGAYPDELSGGQQQRVALARALALGPEILLLDEVTSALDPEMVNEVLDAIRDLANEGITMLIVSHEMAFVREVSDRVVMMADGAVVETGPPGQIFDAPRTERCREFVSKILRH
ncbi:MAG: amino acid ABC transporter ATP-binding protein [Ectothiorhodospiraceae bacterium]|nr:amino acid ABC transporter ATP-binding protein [Ectothiorhodospiraceae bacterium]